MLKIMWNDIKNFVYGSAIMAAVFAVFFTPIALMLIFHKLGWLLLYALFALTYWIVDAKFRYESKKSGT